MERTKEDLSYQEISEMEERRLDRLAEHDIDEMDILNKAQENLAIWDNNFSENITRGKSDMNFALRDQWADNERSDFTRLSKFAMTFNKVYDPIKKIAGEERKNKPDLLVRSLTGHASQEEINLREDLIRTICYQSQINLIYQNAFVSGLLRGYGAFKIEIDYSSPKSFDKVIKGRYIKDCGLAIFDPSAELPHKGDGNYCCNLHIFSKEEFFAKYPYVSNPMSYTNSNTLLNFQWETKDTIIVADYYVKEWFPLKVYKLSNGTSVSEEEWEKLQAEFNIKKELAKNSSVVGDLITDLIPHIVSERQSQDYKIMNYLMIKDKIIDFSEWPSKHLPMVFVDGDSHFIDGKQYTRSFIQDAKDAQRFINFVGSEIASEFKNRRREQWIGTADNIVGNEQMWRNPELQMGILIAKPDPKTGMMPQKMPAWDISPALMQNFQRGIQDVREATGFYDINTPMDRQQESGKALLERKIDGNMSAYVNRDNLNQAIEQSGRIMLDLLPGVYGGDERIITLSSKMGKSKTLVLNKRLPDGTIENPLTPGEFDIEIDTGPSFAVQKSASVDILSQFAQNPVTLPLVADLLAQNLDLQCMPQLSERFQTLVPKDILAKENGEPPPPPQPNPQQQMMDMQMKVQMQQIEERAKELQIRQEKHELEKVKLMLDVQKIQTDSQTNKMDAQLDNKKAELDYSARISKIVSDMHKASM